MKKTEAQFVIDAIATYICIQANRRDRFICDVDTNPIAEMLGATYAEQQSAQQRARAILREFQMDRR